MNVGGRLLTGSEREGVSAVYRTFLVGAEVVQSELWTGYSAVLEFLVGSCYAGDLAGSAAKCFFKRSSYVVCFVKQQLTLHENSQYATNSIINT